MLLPPPPPPPPPLLLLLLLPDSIGGGIAIELTADIPLRLPPSDLPYFSSHHLTYLKVSSFLRN